MAANDLYNAEFMDHVSHPDYKYQMDNPTVSHEGVNPSCGDELTFSVRIEDGKIAEAAFVGSGCAISQASADIMSDLMIDRTPEEAIELCKLFGRMIRGEETDEAVLDQLEDANILHDIAHMPARVKCAELACTHSRRCSRPTTAVPPQLARQPPRTAPRAPTPRAPRTASSRGRNVLYKGNVRASRNG